DRRRFGVAAAGRRRHRRRRNCRRGIRSRPASGASGGSDRRVTDTMGHTDDRARLGHARRTNPAREGRYQRQEALMSARIGIDLGTTNSAVAMVYDDGPSLVPRGSMKQILEPSVVRFEPASTRVWTAGEEADQPYDHVIRSIKRLMGRTYSEAIAQGAQDRFANRSVKLARRHQDDLQLQL